ncbi:MAG: AbrB/MazE/SpoVT family DNA-binding domain-containing protein [Candidatus Pacebacteria bacterium]|nr:AbrB/MazE/SpoVT family DNA-binding domain-containing protein [Candidatus Paceibacterota bacterium]
MKSIGVVRKIDELGRIVLPIELRRTLEIEIGDALEIFTESDTINLKKYQPGCVFCGDVNNVQIIKGKRICLGCRAELR